MLHQLPELPFDPATLAPHLSEETFQYHHGKHHQAYVTNLNKLIPGTEFEDASLEDMIRKASGGIFNNAAQVWNHTFYWNCLSPKGGGLPTGQLLKVLKKTYGGFDEFKEKFSQSAVTLFGSGWAWLVKDDQGNLMIENTSNAANPMQQGKTPLLTCDMWEHAYYIDYRNSRPDYMKAFWNLVNWEFVEKNL